MNYQAIRAAIENPLLSAFGALVPAVPVYFDNITAVPPNTTTEYVRVNITFGITNEPTLTSSVDNARGALIIRIFTEKGRGPARNQVLLTTAVNVLETLNNTAKTNSGTFMRLGEINGPTFSSTEESPHFVGRIDTSWVRQSLPEDCCYSVISRAVPAPLSIPLVSPYGHHCSVRHVRRSVLQTRWHHRHLR